MHYHKFYNNLIKYKLNTIILLFDLNFIPYKIEQNIIYKWENIFELNRQREGERDRKFKFLNIQIN